jgi:CheY-like chemotaxis protein
LRILLVEDNLEISEVMAVYCNTQKDIDCKVINRGREGLDRIRDEKFDLILLDLAMPEFSGKDVIQSLTKDQLVQMNIVIFTASTDPGGIGTYQKYRCQRDIKKTVFIRTVNRIDREISADHLRRALSL